MKIFLVALAFLGLLVVALIFPTTHNLLNGYNSAFNNSAQNTVTLTGNVTDMGTAYDVSVGFEYGLTDSYGYTALGNPNSLTSPREFYAVVTNLSTGTTYHYRTYATGDGTDYGSDQTFATP